MKNQATAAAFLSKSESYTQCAFEEPVSEDDDQQRQQQPTDDRTNLSHITEDEFERERRDDIDFLQCEIGVKRYFYYPDEDGKRMNYTARTGLSHSFKNPTGLKQ